MWFWLLLFFWITMIMLVFYKQLEVKLPLFIRLKRMSHKKNISQLDKLLINHYKAFKKLDRLLLKRYLKGLENYKDYETALQVLGQKDEIEFKICNFIDAENVSMLIKDTRFWLLKNDILTSGNIDVKGQIFYVKHSLNYTALYSQFLNKVYKTEIKIENMNIEVLGAKNIDNKAFSKNGGKFILSAGEKINAFKEISEYIKERDTFLAVYKDIAKCVFLGQEIEFNDLSFEKVLSFPCENIFINSYKIYDIKDYAELKAKLINLFSKFGFKIIAQINCQIDKSILKPPLFAVLDDPKISKYSQNINNFEFKENFIFGDENINTLYQNLSSFVGSLNYQTDTFKLLLVSLFADKNHAYSLLKKVISLQVLEGGIVSFYNSNYCIFDNNNSINMIFPMFLGLYLQKFNDFNILNHKLKYTHLKVIKKNLAFVFAATEKIFPSDTLYEHTVKCLDLAEFKDGLILASNKKNIGGMAKYNFKQKGLFFTFIYLYSLKCFSDYLSENHAQKFLVFAKKIASNVREIISKPSFLQLPKNIKLKILAVAEGLFCEKQFTSTYDFVSFDDFFSHFCVQVGNVKEMDTELLLYYICGSLFENDLDTVYNFVEDISRITLIDNLVGSKIIFDGKYYYGGEKQQNLSLLLYALMREKLSGISVSENKIVFKSLFESLDGKKLFVKVKDSKISLYFKKSGKNKISAQNIAHLNQKALCLSQKNLNTSLTVEF